MRMASRRASAAIALVIGSLIGIGYPLLDLAWACRSATSEACVWGKAYFPLTMVLSVVLLGGVAAALVYAVLSRRRGRDEDADAI
jgi:hypothetical protein